VDPIRGLPPPDTLSYSPQMQIFGAATSVGLGLFLDPSLDTKQKNTNFIRLNEVQKMNDNNALFHCAIEG